MKHYNQFFTKKKPQYILILLYSIAHGGIFFSANGYFWDDHTLVGETNNQIYTIFKESGSFLNFAGWLHSNLLNIGPWIYKVLTFFLFLFAGFFYNSILKRHIELWNAEYRFYCVLIFLLIPIYLVRPALIVFPYGLSFFLFFTAWSIMLKYRALSIILFFISFHIPSFLVLFILPIVELFYSKYNMNIKSIISFSLKHMDFLILPFVYFGLKLIYFKPSGNYEGYNEDFSVQNLLVTPLKMTKELLIELYPLLTVTVIFILISKIFKIKLNYKNLHKQKKNFLFGLILILIACFPYWIVGVVPGLSDWSSRHLILTSLGMSFFITALIFSFSKSMRIFAFCFICSTFIFINIKTYLDFYFDWEKQKQLIVLFQNNPLIKSSNLIFITDYTNNALGRKYRYYEWNSLLSAAFLDEKRFGVEKNNFSTREKNLELLNAKNIEYFKSNFNLNQSKSKDFMKTCSISPIQIEITYSKKSIFSKKNPFIPEYDINILSH